MKKLGWVSQRLEDEESRLSFWSWGKKGALVSSFKRGSFKAENDIA